MRKNLIFSILNVFLSTVFPVIVFPYVARALGANGVGTYNYYNLGISYIALIASFGINVYGVKEIGKYKDQLDKRSKVALELVCLNLINALLFFCIIVCVTLNTHYRVDFSIIILLATTLLSNAFTVEWFFVGIEFQKFILIRSFIIKFLSLLFIIWLVKSPSDLLTYIVIVVAGFFLPAIINFTFFLKELSNFSINNLAVARHLKPLFSIFIVEIAIRYFGMADVVILGLNADKTTVGYYSLALNVFLIVSSFIRISAVTLLPKSAYYLKEKQTEKFNALINSTVKFILFVGIPASVGVFIWSGLIVKILGGSDFRNSAELLKFFSFLIILAAIVNMLVFQVLYPLNRTKNISIAFFVGIGINLILNWVLIPLYSAQGVIYSSIISQVVIFIVLVVMNSEVINRSFISKDMITYVYAGLFLLFSSYFMHKYFKDTIIIPQMIVSAIIYFATLFVFKEKLFVRQALNLLKK